MFRLDSLEPPFTLAFSISCTAAGGVLMTNSNDLSGLGVRMQRVNLGAGDAETDGTRDERIAGTWFNSAAFVDPTGIVQGTLPRTMEEYRTPHRNNWDFVATKAIPIIICTSKGQDTDKAWGMKQGARDYVVKPVSGPELLAKISALG